MKFSNNIPIYIQIANDIIEKIIRDEYKKGEKLLSVREYSIMLKVNVNTVRSAYSELEKRNIIFKKRGIGTFVTEEENIIKKLKEELSLKVVSDFISKMDALGYSEEEILNRIEVGINDNEN